jgi:hypothetical protein
MVRLKQSIDDALQGIGSFVVQKLFSFCPRRREPDPVKVQASKEHAAFGARGGTESAGLKLGKNEGVRRPS